MNKAKRIKHIKNHTKTLPKYNNCGEPGSHDFPLLLNKSGGLISKPKK